MEITLTLNEMIALNKTFNHLRFGDSQGEIKEMAFSSFIIDVHLRLIDKLRTEYKKENIEIPDDFGFIEDSEIFFYAIKANIGSLNNWTNLDSSAKQKIIHLIVKPYKIKEETVRYLIDYKTQ